HLLAGDVGRAVLAYRRAERLDPRAPRGRSSLTYARSLVGTAAPEGGQALAEDALLWWRGVVPRPWVLAPGLAAPGAFRILGARDPAPRLAGAGGGARRRLRARGHRRRSGRRVQRPERGRLPAHVRTTPRSGGRGAGA